MVYTPTASFLLPRSLYFERVLASSDVEEVPEWLMREYAHLMSGADGYDAREFALHHQVLSHEASDEQSQVPEVFIELDKWVAEDNAAFELAAENQALVPNAFVIVVIFSDSLWSDLGPRSRVKLELASGLIVFLQIPLCLSVEFLLHALSSAGTSCSWLHCEALMLDGVRLPDDVPLVTLGVREWQEGHVKQGCLSAVPCSRMMRKLAGFVVTDFAAIQRAAVLIGSELDDHSFPPVAEHLIPMQHILLPPFKWHPTSDRISLQLLTPYADVTPSVSVLTFVPIIATVAELVAQLCMLGVQCSHLELANGEAPGRILCLGATLQELRIRDFTTLRAITVLCPSVIRLHASLHFSRRRVRVMLETLCGSMVVLLIPLSLTGTELLELLHHNHVLCDYLTYCGRVLRGSDSLRSLGVRSRSTLHAMCRQRGGAGSADRADMPSKRLKVSCGDDQREAEAGDEGPVAALLDPDMDDVAEFMEDDGQGLLCESTHSVNAQWYSEVIAELPLPLLSESGSEAPENVFQFEWFSQDILFCMFRLLHLAALLT